jgi:hypothetical protein
MFELEFKEYVKSQGVTDPLIIFHMQETWDHVYANVHSSLVLSERGAE